MNLLYRGLAAGACALGLVAIAASPGDLSAQPKKDDKTKTDPKKEMKKDPVPEDKTKTDVIGSFPTQDGLGIRRYWYTSGKGSADTVLMFPAPGNKLNDNWHALAKGLQKVGFSVMLFDWRGCGINGQDRQGGPERILNKPELYAKDFLYTSAPKNIATKGLDWSKMSGRYRDTVYYDLMGARFALDKQNDAAQCNTNRIWLVSEGTGVHLALSWIAIESQRNTSYVKINRFDDRLPTYTPASLDYVGLDSLSFSQYGPATTIYNSGLPTAGKYAKETIDHLDRRVAMLMLYGKKEGPNASNGVLGKYVDIGNAAEMKKRFKGVHEIDTSSVPNKDIKGAELLNLADSFGTQAYIVQQMTDVRDKNDVGKERSQRDADKIGNDPPTFELGKYKPR